MTEPQTMGGYLRAARRRRRISIERAAEDTKIRSDFLMRMESDEFDFLAPAYVRGFLKTYARYLRVEPDPLLHEFERRFGSGRVDTAHVLAAERKRRHLVHEPRLRNKWVVAAAVAATAIVVLGIVGLTQGGSPPSRVAGEGLGATPTPTPTQSEVEAEPTPTPTPTEDSDAIALADGIEVEVIVARSDCWVDVTADGTKVWSDTIMVGESQTFSADASMTIIFGFPEGVDLIVNGQNFGAPGGVNPVTIKLPDDIDSL